MPEKKHHSLLVIILKIVLSLVLIVVILVAGFSIFAYVKYDVNVLTLGNSLKVLNDPVNTTELAPNQFTDEDMQSCMTSANAKLSGLISYSEEDGYSITPSNVTTPLTSDLQLSDKEIGALVNNELSKTLGTSANVGSTTIDLKDYDLKLLQISFTDITETTCDFNFVASISLVNLKANMSTFPLSLFTKVIPDTMYISSTTTITHGETAFSYTNTHKSLTVNNLTNDQVEEVFTTINKFVEFGTINDFNETISNNFVNTLIGNESATNGFAYSLKSAGATDYSFVQTESANYFVVKA